MDSMSTVSPLVSPEQGVSSSVLVANDEEDPSPASSRPAPSQLPFTATPQPARQVQVGAFALLLSVMQLCTGVQDLTIGQLASPDYEGPVSYIKITIEDGTISREFPHVPPDRYPDLHRAAASQLSMYQATIARSAHSLASPGASLLATELAGAAAPDKRWAFNGTSCSRLNDSGGKVSLLFWLESLESALRGELGIRDARIQGQHLRRLLEGPLLDQLLRKLEELPDLRTAAATGTATFADYATALIACADPDDTLAVHRAATQPARKAGEKLSDAAARAELAFRSAAAHGCQPGEAGRFWAVFGLLTTSERSTFTGRPGVRGRMQRPLRESMEAATARHVALLSDLLAWAKVQSTTSTPAPPRPGPSRTPTATAPTAAAGGDGRGNARLRRRGPAASAAAADAAVAGPAAFDSSSEDEAGVPAPSATAAPASAPMSPRSPRAPAVFHYTGDRARDAVETARRRTSGECLKCLPGSSIHPCPCPLHPPNHLESSAPRCVPYRD